MEEDVVEWDRAEVRAGMGAESGAEEAAVRARDWAEWEAIQQPEPEENVSVRNADIGRSTREGFPAFRRNVLSAVR